MVQLRNLPLFGISGWPREARDGITPGFVKAVMRQSRVVKTDRIEAITIQIECPSHRANGMYVNTQLVIWHVWNSNSVRMELYHSGPAMILPLQKKTCLPVHPM